MELFAGALDTVITYFTSGVASFLASSVKDLARLSLLYCLKSIMFKGNLSDEDVLNILGDFVHRDDYLTIAGDQIGSHGPSFLLWSGQ